MGGYGSLNNELINALNLLYAASSSCRTLLVYGPQPCDLDDWLDTLTLQLLAPASCSLRCKIPVAPARLPNKLECVSGWRVLLGLALRWEEVDPAGN